MYWIAVASLEHVQRGVAEGIAQVCHGKAGPLNQMTAGDWIVYYSPTKYFGTKTPYRKFTAMGRIQSGKPYQYQMSDDFIPWRRDVLFLATEEASIEPLIELLSFIKDKKRWGFPFRKGCFKISYDDFKRIAITMGIHDPSF